MVVDVSDEGFAYTKGSPPDGLLRMTLDDSLRTGFTLKPGLGLWVVKSTPPPVVICSNLLISSSVMTTSSATCEISDSKDEPAVSTKFSVFSFTGAESEIIDGLEGLLTFLV